VKNDLNSLLKSLSFGSSTQPLQKGSLLLIIPNFTKHDIQELENSDIILEKIQKIIKCEPKKAKIENLLPKFNPDEFLKKFKVIV